MEKVLILVLVAAIAADITGAMPRKIMRQQTLNKELQARSEVAPTDYEEDEGDNDVGHGGFASARPRMPQGGNGGQSFERIPGDALVGRR
ncbi:hypothetical protein MTO96_044016, partial [Rhipicephalus appendiculatus]